MKLALPAVMQALERDHGVVRSAVLLMEGDVEPRLYIEAASGLPPSGRAARFNLGEGIIGKVVETGKPAVVPQISNEPAFLNRAGQRNEGERRRLSFMCTPIRIRGRSIGALGVDLPFTAERDYESTLTFLHVIADMIGQAIQVSRAAKADEESGDRAAHLRGRLDFSNIIGNSAGIREVYEQIELVAPTNTTVLLRGESGTGKELFAGALHLNSRRSGKPFIKISCAALPETLIESELFGYEKGAFTGAEKLKQGRFELAEEGTLFLDEIGELNLSLQAKLLRVLQNKEFERLGGTRTIKADVRLVAATNKDLEAAITTGTFRPDLYYRLNVFTIFIPPLRERKPDILLLADHFLEKYAAEHGKDIKRISTPAIDMLTGYHWPGNVRELENTLERAVLMCRGQVIHGHHLPPTLQTAEASGTVNQGSLEEAVATYEKDLLLDALKTTRGNRAMAARLLKTTERIIGYKVRKYRIDCSRFR